MEEYRISDDVYEQIKDFSWLTEEQDFNRWKRDRSQRVVLKYIYNSQDNIAEFLREVESHVIANECGSVGVIRCYGIAKNPETNEYMMIMEQGMNDIIYQYWDGDSLKRPTADEMAAWNFDNNCWERYGRRVVLKCIHNSQDNIAELLKEAESHVE
ncbi:uncharacterized protein OCT59_014202 [Rhizophagus irregularis]|uniref:uncharacterized protein n=1 Tax=Rhizophagus irregularis TaxID=588596 RepID=UPI00331ED8AC|nr:hypothetical protein OCT59_014202 [Rhizophagus irregularis]